MEWIQIGQGVGVYVFLTLIAATGIKRSRDIVQMKEMVASMERKLGALEARLAELRK